MLWLLHSIYFPAQPDCRIFLSENCNAIIKQQLCGEECCHIKLFIFYFYFVVIFVAFSPNWCFPSDCSFCLYHRHCDTNDSTPSLTRTYCNWKSITSPWCKNKLETHPDRSVLKIWLCSSFHPSALEDLRIISFFCFFSMKVDIIK